MRRWLVLWRCLMAMATVLALAGCAVAPAVPSPLATPVLAPGPSASPTAPPATDVPPTVRPSPTSWSGSLQWPAGTVALYGVAERMGTQEALELYALDAMGSATSLGVRVPAGARISDDGRWIVYLDAPPPVASAVVVRNLQSGVTRSVQLGLAAGGGSVGPWAFDRDGSRLAFLEVAPPGMGKCAAWSITVVQLASGWSARFERASECSLLPGIPLGWSSYGDLLLDVFRPYTERSWANVWAFALPPGHPARPIESLSHRQLLAPEAQGWGVRLSPGGTRLLYLAHDPGYTPAGLEGANPDMAVNQLWTLDVRSPGGQPTQLIDVVDGGALARLAAWSPGGDAILFVQGRYPPGSGAQGAGPLLGAASLKVADLTGAVRTVGPLPEAGDLTGLEWCTPATALATLTRGTRQALYAVDLAAGQATRVAEAPQLAVLGCLPAQSPTLGNVEPPVGLVYRRADGLLYQVRTGQEQRPVAWASDVLSPDGRRALYVRDGDIWLKDLRTGERRNMTAGLGVVAVAPLWWPGQPERILFFAHERTVELEPGMRGYLATVALDGSGYQLLDGEHEAGPVAPAPDGQTIAYGAGWLYRWGQGVETFDPAAYGLPGARRLTSPAWSPDGTRLAWRASGAIAVFDLAARTGRLLHPYEGVGMGGWESSPSWSPDGRWLSTYIRDQNPEQAGLWLLRPDGSEERRLGNGSYTWSPDSGWIAITTSSQSAPTVTTLVEVGTWRRQEIMLPDDAYVVSWLAAEAAK